VTKWPILANFDPASFPVVRAGKGGPGFLSGSFPNKDLMNRCRYGGGILWGVCSEGAGVVENYKYKEAEARRQKRGKPSSKSSHEQGMSSGKRNRIHFAVGRANGGVAVGSWWGGGGGGGGGGSELVRDGAGSKAGYWVGGRGRSGKGDRVSRAQSVGAVIP